MSTETYLRFINRGPQGGKPILWPVWVWKVLYPEPKTISLNLFQQSILELSRARCRDRYEISRLLCLDQDLVNFIIATQLIPNNWMNVDGSLTSTGEKVLDDIEGYEEELHAGYAFQDGISGAWLPRFCKDLSIIEPDKYDESGYPAFLQSKDSGKHLFTFKLKGFCDFKEDIVEVFNAYRKYKNDYGNAIQRERHTDMMSRINFDSLSYIEQVPTKMWLWTWVFHDNANSEPWLIADPFGLQKAAAWLRKPLKTLLPSQDSLARYISSGVKQACPKEMSASEWLESLEHEVDHMLMAEYPWSQRVPMIRDYLASVLRCRVAIDQNNRPTREDMRSLLIETHLLAESTLQWMLKKYPINIRQLPDKSADASWDKKTSIAVLNTLGLDCLEPDIVNKLASQQLKDIRNAFIHGSSSMKALLVAVMFSTAEHTDHPLHKLSKDSLQLGSLLDMANDRNRKAGHSSSEKLTKEVAMKHADFMITWVNNFKEWY